MEGSGAGRGHVVPMSGSTFIAKQSGPVVFWTLQTTCKKLSNSKYLTLGNDWTYGRTAIRHREGGRRQEDRGEGGQGGGSGARGVLRLACLMWKTNTTYSPWALQRFRGGGRRSNLKRTGGVMSCWVYMPATCIAAGGTVLKSCPPRDYRVVYSDSYRDQEHTSDQTVLKL